MPIRKCLLLLVIVNACVLLSGCPMSSVPTKEQPASSGASSSTPATPSPSGGGQSRQSSSGSPSSGSSQVIPSSSARSSSKTNQTAIEQGEHKQPKQSEGELVDVSDQGGQSNEGSSGDQAQIEGGTNQQQEPDLSDDEPVMGHTTQEQEPDLTDEEAGSTASSRSEKSQTMKSSGSETATAGAVTSGERISILDRELSQSSGSFDQMILREREHIRTRAKQNGGIMVGSANEEFEAVQEPVMTSSAEEGAPPPPGAPANEGASERSRAGNRPATVASYTPPIDIPDGNDDDVVARQLREAAIKEPNAKLREKLWNEYRKYKGLVK
ncbi:MAG: hypothetical protein JKY66_04940 [Spongiibacteraceae bacterium]|nr:hypothetical protein [Spongiibacteraceae bacterium]